MDFFNNVGKKLGKTAKTVGKKSEELVEITKTNLAIGNEEDKIKKMLAEMGNELYTRFGNGERFDASLNDKCAQIKAVEDNIAELKEKIKSLKGHNSNPDNSEETEIKEEANYRLDNDNKSEDQ